MCDYRVQSRKEGHRSYYQHGSHVFTQTEAVSKFSGLLDLPQAIRALHFDFLTPQVDELVPQNRDTIVQSPQLKILIELRQS